MLYFLRTLLTIIDFLFIVILGYFSSNLRWSNQKDRPSIVGFGAMACAFAGSIALMWL